MSDPVMERSSSEEIEEIVFGDECHWCARSEPCFCHPLAEVQAWRARTSVTEDEQRAYDAKCKCSCGRCTTLREPPGRGAGNLYDAETLIVSNHDGEGP